MPINLYVEECGGKSSPWPVQLLWRQEQMDRQPIGALGGVLNCKSANLKKALASHMHSWTVTIINWTVSFLSFNKYKLEQSSRQVNDGVAHTS